MNIGFDLDKIFINYPPFIPSELINRLYKQKSNGVLLYRIPPKLEQIIRIISHHPLLRPPILENIEFVKRLSKNKKHKYYLISSRFSFLRKRANNIINKYQFDKIFDAMVFNYDNKQPHLFKNQAIKELKIDSYVDDDLPLLEFTAKNNRNTKFFWLNKNQSKKLSKNIYAINKLSEMIK
jgi:hypothetical protein